MTEHHPKDQLLAARGLNRRGLLAAGGWGVAAAGGLAGPAAARVLADDARPEAMARVAGEPWLESPAVAPDGTVYFPDVKGDQILAKPPSGPLRVFRHPANYPNGMVFDGRGGLAVCEIGGIAPLTPPRLTRIDMASGRTTVLADNFEGRGLLGPNDVTFDGRGRLYFTDLGRAPFIDPLPPGAAPAFPRPVESPGLYRLDLDGGLSRLLGGPEIVAPNGLVLSPDDRTLYLIDRRQILAFDLPPEGPPRNRRLFHDFAPGRGGDGMTIDTAGNLWVAAGLNKASATSPATVPGGVHVFAPDGRQVGFLAVPEDTITNVAFGGPGLRTLYMTAGRTLYRARTLVRGTRR